MMKKFSVITITQEKDLSLKICLGFGLIDSEYSNISKQGNLNAR